RVEPPAKQIAATQPSPLQSPGRNRDTGRASTVRHRRGRSPLLGTDPPTTATIIQTESNGTWAVMLPIRTRGPEGGRHVRVEEGEFSGFRWQQSGGSARLAVETPCVCSFRPLLHLRQGHPRGLPDRRGTRGAGHR